MPPGGAIVNRARSFGRQTGSVRLVRDSAVDDRPTERRLKAALRVCGDRRNLQRTCLTALVVGVLLTVINQVDVLLDGRATTLTWVKIGLNFCVPFVVTNVGLLAGARTERS
jgi:hypothetical protein